MDGSDPLFSLYNEMTETHDQKVVENWKSDADSAVITVRHHFSLTYRCTHLPQNGLFSVVVAILLVKSYERLKLNSQDASAFYLSRIYQLSAGLNDTSTSLPFDVPDPSTFSPDASIVRASAFWTVSLVISLSCLVFATLLRQWAQRYLHITRQPRGQRKRARIREFTAQGVEKLQFQRISTLLPGLFHLSVFSFICGLYHYTSNNTIDLVFLSTAGIFLGIYVIASIISSSPIGIICHTPLSSLVWYCWPRFFFLAYKLLYNSSLWFRFVGIRTRLLFLESARAHYSRTLRDWVADVDDLARKHSSFLDTSVVSRLFNSLDGHQDMEHFLFSIPGFYRSIEAKKEAPVLEKLNGMRLAPAISSFMNHSLSSDLLTRSEKVERITIFLGAIAADPLLLQCTFRHTANLKFRHFQIL